MARGNAVLTERELPHDELWTADDVARYLRTSRSWVYQRAQAGELPSVKLAGLLRFHPAAIREYACKGERP